MRGRPAFPRTAEFESREPVSLVRYFLSALNRRDLAEFPDMIGLECRFEDPFAGAVTGLEAVRALWERRFTECPDFVVETEALLREGEQVALFGRMRGSFEKAGFPGERQARSLRFAVLVDIRDDQIVRWRCYTEAGEPPGPI